MRRGKADVFTEHVDRFKQLFLPQRGQYLIADQREVGFRILSVFRRNGMGRQQRWADIDRIIEAQLACDLQHFLFGLGVEAVSRFDFNRGDAFIYQTLKPLLCQIKQGFG